MYIAASASRIRSSATAAWSPSTTEMPTLQRTASSLCAARADVTAVEHDAADVLVLGEVGVEDLELADVLVAVAQRAFEDARLAVRRRLGVRQHLQQAGPVGAGDEQVEAGAHDLLGLPAEHALDRRALVADDAVGPDDGDEVARVLDKRAEPRLGAPAVQLAAHVLAVDRERDLVGERSQQLLQRLSGLLLSGHQEQARAGATRRDRDREPALAVRGDAEGLEVLRCQLETAVAA